MGSASGETRPTVALAMGDPAGISPELTAKLLALPEVRAAAQLIVIGDRRVLEEGARVAKVALDIGAVAPQEPLPANPARPLFVDLGHLDPAAISIRPPSSGAGSRRPAEPSPRRTTSPPSRSPRPAPPTPSSSRPSTRAPCGWRRPTTTTKSPLPPG
jgi:hypothetical protein